MSKAAIAGRVLLRVCGTMLVVAVLCSVVVTPVFAKHTHAHHAAPKRKPKHETAEDIRFHAFLHEFRKEALRAGIERSVYDRATSDIERNPRVQQLNEEQPEFVLPIWDYLASALSDKRVGRGQEMLTAYGPLFARLEKQYGVPRETLAAIWGLESSYGESKGSFNLFEALATLAYDGPRQDYGRTQFLAAFKIAQQEHLDPKEMMGSWAGAIGHTQFVPTTFLDHAVDGDGDGKRDLTNSVADALASTANYLKESGWREGAGWGEEVQLPKDFPYGEADPDIRKTRDSWREKGVLSATGDALKGGSEEGSIYLPAGYRGPAFLLLDNFNVLLTYNTAASYALAVGLLSDRFKGGGMVTGSWPRDEQPLTHDQRLELQADLALLGYDIGKSDALLGKRTRSALRQYQKANGLPPDGFPTIDLFYKILEQVHAKRVGERG